MEIYCGNCQLGHLILLGGGGGQGRFLCSYMRNFLKSDFCFLFFFIVLASSSFCCNEFVFLLSSFLSYESFAGDTCIYFADVFSYRLGCLLLDVCLFLFYFCIPNGFRSQSLNFLLLSHKELFLAGKFLLGAAQCPLGEQDDAGKMKQFSLPVCGLFSSFFHCHILITQKILTKGKTLSKLPLVYIHEHIQLLYLYTILLLYIVYTRKYQNQLKRLKWKSQ